MPPAEPGLLATAAGPLGKCLPCTDNALRTSYPGQVPDAVVLAPVLQLDRKTKITGFVPVPVCLACRKAQLGL